MIFKVILIIISSLILFSCQSTNTVPLSEKKKELIKFTVTRDLKVDTD